MLHIHSNSLVTVQQDKEENWPWETVMGDSICDSFLLCFFFFLDEPEIKKKKKFLKCTEKMKEKNQSRLSSRPLLMLVRSDNV